MSTKSRYTHKFRRTKSGKLIVEIIDPSPSLTTPCGRIVDSRVCNSDSEAIRLLRHWKVTA